MVATTAKMTGAAITGAAMAAAASNIRPRHSSLPPLPSPVHHCYLKCAQSESHSHHPLPICLNLKIRHLACNSTNKTCANYVTITSVKLLLPAFVILETNQERSKIINDIILL